MHGWCSEGLQITIQVERRKKRGRVSRSWPSAHHSETATWNGFATHVGRTAASRRQLPSWRWASCEGWDKKRERERKKWTPHRSAREAERVIQTVGSSQACVRLASTWECLGKLSAVSPPHLGSHTNTLLPCLEHMVHQQRHLATLTPGSCASSSPVGSLGTATSSTTCGSSWVKKKKKKGGGRWIIPTLQLQTWLPSKSFGCKHLSASQNTCRTHATARLATTACVLHNVMRCPRVMARLIWGESYALWWLVTRSERAWEELSVDQ